ncbi:MAG: hypothetical protein DSO07_06940 [Thermoproteota archaeon]|jgi:NADH:ubiquinone oxidoreductase subunit K|uniref:NADH-quinone oxidoreductase subunit K n=1 Tax=Candidatus Methanodesulfokora washburnensis TaxID=2478471 RepID=A0A3R9R0L4_9CREN|nr:NADH-quinone oxidoreductase subunit K [Candidatus Methanodesulfokores washburnensis]RSN71706.1 hypothetical protein D6D85_15345 [Candidatus Methanodesulfokores washburnensis]RZN62094.1 MAG: hypothetical protein EF810_03690 [Candidatus Methanodesulfokores washburnensis]TDA40991.1 MAG: hypothetical protein DSO07_06940 [Candidatus Korarchaeota archaeon]
MILLVYTLMSAVLVALGIFGLVSRGNAAKILISIELLSSGAAGLVFFPMLAISRSFAFSQSLIILFLSVDSVTLGITIAVLFIAVKRSETGDMNKLNELRG